MYIVRKGAANKKMFDLTRQFVPCEKYKLLINCIFSLFIEYILSVVFWFMFYDRCYSFSV